MTKNKRKEKEKKRKGREKRKEKEKRENEETWYMLQQRISITSQPCLANYIELSKQSYLSEDQASREPRVKKFTA